MAGSEALLMYYLLQPKTSTIVQEGEQKILTARTPQITEQAERVRRVITGWRTRLGALVHIGLEPPIWFGFPRGSRVCGV